MSHFGKKSSSSKIVLKYYEQLIIGGSSAIIGHSIVHPIDVLKIRMQVDVSKKVGMMKTAINTIKNDGLMSFTSGLSACMTRHMVYSSIRIGAYPIVRDLISGDNGDQFLPLYKKILASGSTGIFGSFIANPNDVVLVRMQANPTKYKNVFDGFVKVIKKEGVLSLWRGCFPTVLRAAFINAGQLASYDQIKQILLHNYKFEDNMVTHLISSFSAGFIAIGISNPVDVIKTRIMNDSGKYKGVIDCGIKVFKNEGIRGFYKGFLPAASRTIPVTVLMLMIYEKGWIQMRKGTFGRVRLCRLKEEEGENYMAMKILHKTDIIRLKQVDHVISERVVLEIVDSPYYEPYPVEENKNRFNPIPKKIQQKFKDFEWNE